LKSVTGSPVTFGAIVVGEFGSVVSELFEEELQAAANTTINPALKS
jgi:hypothetical protein